MIEFTYRPLSAGPAWEDDGRREYQTCRFRAAWNKTLRELRDELRRIGAKRPVIELDLRERDIRQDGLPRADARPSSSRVRISFEHPELGRLAYPCDTYSGWQDNVRAIVLTLAAQRAMERYGATRRSQQYTGWKQLPGGPPMSREEAAGVLAAHARSRGITADAILRQVLGRGANGIARTAYRWAAKHTHPDRGGDAETFKRVQRAADVLGVLDREGAAR